jgi:cysteine desulfuration protein SufE
MNRSCLNKSDEIKKIFTPLSQEQRYNVLIEMGRNLPYFPADWKTPENIVRGCQSTLYLHSFFESGKIIFNAFSDALISAGLAAILIAVYSNETSETILKSSPIFLQEIGITSSLSPNRSNGLAQIYLRMKQEALKYLR